MPHALVVDDEPAIRRYLRTALRAHGYVVVEAPTGQDGLAGAAVQRPDLIILDLGLPDLDGLEVTRQLREWTRVPIIILSVRGHDHPLLPEGVPSLLPRGGHH